MRNLPEAEMQAMIRWHLNRLIGGSNDVRTETNNQGIKYNILEKYFPRKRIFLNKNKKLL